MNVNDHNMSQFNSRIMCYWISLDSFVTTIDYSQLRNIGNIVCMAKQVLHCTSIQYWIFICNVRCACDHLLFFDLLQYKFFSTKTRAHHFWLSFSINSIFIKLRLRLLCHNQPIKKIHFVSSFMFSIIVHSCWCYRNVIISFTYGL